MPDSQLNEAERHVQRLFMKSLISNAFLMMAAVFGAFWLMNGWPQRIPQSPATLRLSAKAVALPAAGGPLRLAGAWELEAADRRLFGLSGLAIDEKRFVAVGDTGSVMRFDRPGPGARIQLADLGDGPGPFGAKFTRDAESLLADGDGWLVGYEQSHSIWRYDRDFRNGRQVASLGGRGWPNNRGAEGLSRDGPSLLAWREGGQEVRVIANGGEQSVPLRSDWAVADAASAPDGTTWLLLRHTGLGGIEQGIATVRRKGATYALGPVLPLAKQRLDNFEGMAIEPAPGGGLRFWLVSDDGSRVLARTLLAAFDLPPPAPAGAGPTSPKGEVSCAARQRGKHQTTNTRR